MVQPTSFDFEEWRDIPGYEGYYQVSNHGRVRSMNRLDAMGHRLKGKLRKLDIDSDGYRRVVLTRHGVREKMSVHHLVLEAFVSPRPDGMMCCHNDGNPANNHVSNLRWGTNSSNMRDRVKHGTDAQSNRTHCPRDHELIGDNLMPSNLRAGKRACLACDRARGYIKYRPHLRDQYQQISDSYYASLMGRAA